MQLSHLLSVRDPAPSNLSSDERLSQSPHSTQNSGEPGEARTEEQTVSSFHFDGQRRSTEARMTAASLAMTGPSMNVSEEVLRKSSRMERDSIPGTELGVEGAEGSGGPADLPKAKVGGGMRMRIREPLKKFLEGSKVARLLQKASRVVLSEEKDPSAFTTTDVPCDVFHAEGRASTGSARTNFPENDGVQHDQGSFRKDLEMKNLRMFFVDAKNSVNRPLDVTNGGAWLYQVAEGDDSSDAMCVMKLDIGAQRVEITLELKQAVTGDSSEIPTNMKLESMDGVSMKHREMELSAWYSGLGDEKLEFKIETDFSANPALENRMMVTHGPIDFGPCESYDTTRHQKRRDGTRIPHESLRAS